MKFYRYEIVEYAVLDHDGEFTSPRFPNPKVELKELEMFEETPKGYWIGYGWAKVLQSKWKWVSKTAKKRYAYPSKQEALINFIKRNERRVKILKWQIDSCLMAVSIGKEMLLKNQQS